MTLRFLLSLALSVLLCTSARAEYPATFEVGALTFKRPAAWGWVPTTSTMRKAQLSVPGGDKPTEITFFYFGTAGAGDVQENVNRWFRQFKGSPEAQKQETQTFGTTKVTFVSTEGTFSSGMPGGAMTPMDNFGLLGAILENAGGNVFVKMTGPKDLVQSNRQQFTDFIAEAAKSAK